LTKLLTTIYINSNTGDHVTPAVHSEITALYSTIDAKIRMGNCSTDCKQHNLSY